MIKVISKEQWGELANPFPLCTFPLTVFEAERILNVEFFEYLEDGLGKCFGAYLEIDDSQASLQGFFCKNSLDLGILVMCNSTERNPLILVEKLREVFSTEPTWTTESLSPPKYGLFRLDDNGNEFEIYRFLDEASAQAVKLRFEKSKHKQAYFIKVVGGS
ncbi:hypothetical protein [Kangiella sp. M94]